MSKNIEFWAILKLNQKSLFNSSNDPKFGHLCYHLNIIVFSMNYGILWVFYF